MSGTEDNVSSHSAISGSVISDTPVFVTGFARSGTTWVNRLIRDYFDAGLVNEAQFIVSFGNRIQKYGDLGTAQSRNRLIHDLSRDEFFSILLANYSILINWSRVDAVCRSFSSIVKDVLVQIAEQMGKSRIGAKYPVFGRHLGLLNSLFPDCRVIHVVRDGRDCALSHRRMTWGYQNAYSAAVHWRGYLEATQRGAMELQDRYLEVRYEDLLLEPGTAMAGLERFITGRQDQCITERFLADRSLLKTEKVERWREKMPTSTQAVFESVAGDMLALYGYPVTGEYRLPSMLSRASYIAHDKLSREGWHLARKMFKAIPEHKP